MAKPKIEDPILLHHAEKEFGMGRKWMLARMERGEIQHQRVGRYVVLERTDVEKLVGDRGGWNLVARAVSGHAKRRK